MLLHIHFCPDCLRNWDCKSCGYEERKKIKTCLDCCEKVGRTNEHNPITPPPFTSEQLLRLEAAKFKFKEDQFINQYFQPEDEIRANSFGIILTDKPIVITDKTKEECKQELELGARAGYKLTIMDK